MATAVTLKESDGSEIYPVTDISLVNNGIHAVDIQATTPVPSVETAMIADGAVTDAKIDWSSMTVTSGAATVNSTYITHGGIAWRKIGRIVFLLIQDVTITADIPANSNTLAASGIPMPHSGFNYNLMNIVTPKSSRTLRLRLQDDKLYFHWTNGAAATEFDGEYVYIAAAS